MAKQYVRIACILALAGSLALLQACGSDGGAPPENSPETAGPAAPASPAEPAAPIPPSNPAAPAPAPAGAQPPPVPSTGSGPGAAPAASGLSIFFRLDPRTTTAGYLGERWVSPVTFTLLTVAGADVLVDARAHVTDPNHGRAVSAAWAVADAEMLAVSPAEGHQVTISVLRAGTTSLSVASPEGTRQLAVTAVQDDSGGWRVDFTQ